MRSYEYIKARQLCWAWRHGKRLGGQFRNDSDPTQADRGEKLFVYDLDDNLFEPLTPEARAEFESGDGGELGGRMHAVHSSSALVVDVFDYWRKRGLFAEIAGALRVPSVGITGMRFEAKFSIHDQFNRAPNLDVVIDYDGRGGLKATAIESKFNEPYGGGPMRGLNEAYLRNEELWSDFPNLRRIAEEISPENTRFTALDVPQLIKHVLGLKRAYGVEGFRLLYLWCDAPGREAVKHAEEIEEFAQCLESDGVHFQSLTYQDVIWSLAKNQRARHREFVDHLTERYL